MNKKDTGIAYICWLFGLHYLYLGRPVMWVLFVLSLFIWVGILWWIIDLFRIPSMVNEHNANVERANVKHSS